MSLVDGIYFNMPDDEYHSQQRMSASGICNMLVSPSTFWANSWLNPDLEEINKDTPARILGRAYHTARLEPHLLDKKFVCELDLSQYEGVLTTSSQIEEKLLARGLPKKVSGESVIGRAYRLEDAGYRGYIKHILEDEWEQCRAGRTAIGVKFWKQLTRDMAAIKEIPDVNKHLTDGEAEVSVLWTDEKTKIKMKCRFDYLKADSFTDLKTFDNANRKNLDQCIYDAFRYNRYYIQAYLYWIVTEMIRRAELDIKGNPATNEQSELINSIRASSVPLQAWYVFQEKSGIPNLLAREIHILTKVHPSHTSNAAGVSCEVSEEVAQKTRRLSALGQLSEMEVRQSLSLFGFYSESHGKGQPWGSINPTGVIDDDCFPPYWLGLEQ